MAAVTSAGRGNSSEKVTIEPAGKGERPGPGAGVFRNFQKLLCRILVLPKQGYVPSPLPVTVAVRSWPLVSLLHGPKNRPLLPPDSRKVTQQAIFGPLS